MDFHCITPGWQPPSGSPELSADALDVVGMMESVYVTHSFTPPWTGYMVLGENEWIGTCAFKTPPQDGRVEIAYYTFPGHEGKGIASRMAAWLVATTREGMPGITVFAQTLPEESVSTRILAKNGFVRTGELQHPEDGLVWEWEFRGEATGS